MDDRAVSQSIGFVLTFSIIIASVGLVSIVGYDQIQTARDNEQAKNAERAFLLIGQNIDEIERGQSPARRGELDLASGSLDVLPASQSQLRVQISDVGGPPADYDRTFPMRGLRYSTDETTVVYEGGSVIRDNKPGIVVQDGPTLVCTEDTAMVSVVTIEGEENRQLSSATVSMTVRKNTTSITFPRNRTGENSTEGRATVAVTVDSEFDEGWQRSLSEHDHWDQSGANPNRFVCNGPSGGGVSEYHLVHTRINVTFTR